MPWQTGAEGFIVGVITLSVLSAKKMQKCRGNAQKQGE